MAGVRILIADGYEIVRHGLRKLVEAQPGCDVCGEASSAEALLDLATSQAPDIAVLGVPLPGPDLAAVTGHLRAGRPGPEVLLYAGGDDLEAISGALAAGARGCVLKAEDLGQLATAIGALAGRRSYLSPGARQLLGPDASAQENLTSREVQVVRLIAQGESSRKIARLLNISPKTAESHRAAAMRKSGARSIAHLIRFAIRRRLISN